MKGYEALAAAVAEEGTEVTFGLLGDGNMLFQTVLTEEHGVRFVSARHEAGAVAMADGYARATGRPGVCTVTHGPGLTQCGTPLTAARIARSPVLLIAGNTPKGFRLHGQNIEQQPFALATAGAWQEARMPETLAEDVALAFRHVRLGKGPLVFDVGLDAQRAEVGEGWHYTPSMEGIAPTSPRPPDAERVADVARLLEASERPAIIAGRGAIAADAREPIVALADRIGACLATTLLAKGWFSDHPFNLGIAGGFSDDLAREVFAEADLVIAFGASLNQFTTSHGALFPHAQLVQVELDAERIGSITPVDQAIVGDAAATAKALFAALDELSITPKTELRPVNLAGRVAANAPLAGVDFAGPDGGADPREVALTFDRLLPPGRVVLTGIGHYTGYASIYVGVDDPRDLILPWQLGSVGLGLPAAIGAAVGRPDQTVVVFEGDGGIMMSLPELETAARCGVPLLVVVLDDGAYGAELHILRRHGLPTGLSLFDNPDFPAVAQTLGLESHDAPTVEDLERLLPDLFPLSGPTLVRVAINQDVVHEEVFRALTG